LAAGAGKGFTLIELLLVMVILTILAALVMPKFTGQTEKTRVTAAKTQIDAFKLSLDGFEVSCGRYPTTAEGLQALVAQPANLKGWRKFMDNIPLDPWGNPYKYACPGQHNSDGFDLSSGGPDAKEGTDDPITNWSQN
jgi:general secretion pathway protein G